MTNGADRRPDELPYLTVEEVASRLRVSRWRVFELIRAGELASFKPGRCRLIPASALFDYVNRMIEEAA